MTLITFSSYFSSVIFCSYLSYVLIVRILWLSYECWTNKCWSYTSATIIYIYNIVCVCLNIYTHALYGIPISARVCVSQCVYIIPSFSPSLPLSFYPLPFFLTLGVCACLVVLLVCINMLIVIKFIIESLLLDVK